jgi:uncharacterized iron-regulated protein
MRFFIFLFLPGTAAVILFLSGCTKQPAAIKHTIGCNSDFYSLKSAQCIDFDRLLNDVEYYPVIFVGDHHDSAEVHRFVGSLIWRLHEKGYRVFVANEWFTPQDNALLEKYAASKIDDANFSKNIDWNKRTSYKLTSFLPIYHAARKSGSGLFGINMSRSIRKKISDNNISGMSAEDINLYGSLDMNATAHKELLSRFFTHCHFRKGSETDRECLGRMYRVQVAWDTKMAAESAKLAARLLKGPKDKLIVFAGAFHLSYGLGVNMRFSRLSNLPFVTILPAERPLKSIDVGESDFLFLYSRSKLGGGTS